MINLFKYVIFLIDFLWVFCLFGFYLFMKRGRDIGRGRSRLPEGSLTWDLILDPGITPWVETKSCMLSPLSCPEGNSGSSYNPRNNTIAFCLLFQPRSTKLRKVTSGGDSVFPLSPCHSLFRIPELWGAAPWQTGGWGLGGTSHRLTVEPATLTAPAPLLSGSLSCSSQAAFGFLRKDTVERRRIHFRLGGGLGFVQFLTFPGLCWL